MRLHLREIRAMGSHQVAKNQTILFGEAVIVYVNPFWLGVLVAVVVEIVAFTLFCLYLAGKGVRRK